jgi:serine/threonine protein kinase
MNTSSDVRDPIEELAEEFVVRKRRGEKPSMQEYCDKYPDLADDIRELFPALAMVEELGDSSPTTSPRPAPGGASPFPEHIGDYRILREVGRGGMGVVYEAEQESLGRRVALKVLPASALLDAKHVARFEREARAAARLHHTNIVPVFGVGRQASTHYYVMQFIQGQGLDEVIAELRRLRGRAEPTSPNGSATLSQAGRVAEALVTGTFHPGATLDPGPEPAPSTNDETRLDSSAPRLPQGSEMATLSGSDQQYYRSVARIGLQVAQALDYAHNQGVLHRDIKPSNLLLDWKGIVWVTDFGLAKAGDAADLTHTGDIVGTLRYMAPERFQGLSDARSDVYSLGLPCMSCLDCSRPSASTTVLSSCTRWPTTSPCGCAS